MMNLPVKAALAAVATMGAVAGFAVPAQAANDLILVQRVAHLSPTHSRVFVGVRVECGPDTDSAVLSATLTEVTHGSVQTATGTVANIGSFECSGLTETVIVPIRRPYGGYNWDAGAARVSHVTFVTHDLTGFSFSALGGRTVIVK
jgi:hypothetical protein